MNKKILWLAVSGLLALSLVVAACSPATTQTPPTTPVTPTTPNTTTPPVTTVTPSVEWGIVEIRVTDPPPADVKSAVVYLSNIEVHKVSENATESDNESGTWIPVIGAPASFDLMDVIGVEQILGSANLTAGSFTQIRMDVTKVTGETTDNVSYTAEVPSDKLRIVGAFNVGGGNKTILTLDFDGEKSLVRTGEGKFLFKPVVKLLVNSGGKTAQENAKPSDTGNATGATGTEASEGKGEKP